MSTSKFPPEVTTFIGSYIDSVEQLEMLILLRIHRERGFTPAELASEMRSNESSARKRLSGLVTHGFVTSGDDDFYRYAADVSADSIIASIATSYVTRRYAVIEAIFAPQQDKLDAFAEAFRFRKKSDDDG